MSKWSFNLMNLALVVVCIIACICIVAGIGTLVWLLLGTMK